MSLEPCGGSVLVYLRACGGVMHVVQTDTNNKIWIRYDINKDGEISLQVRQQKQAQTGLDSLTARQSGRQAQRVGRNNSHSQSATA